MLKITKIKVDRRQNCHYTVIVIILIVIIFLPFPISLPKSYPSFVFSILIDEVVAMGYFEKELVKSDQTLKKASAQ